MARAATVPRSSRGRRQPASRGRRDWRSTPFSSTAGADLGDWNAITGSNKTEFASIPAWNANPYYTNPYVTVYNNSGQNINSLPTVKSWAQAICGQAGFTGGPTTVVQYMWGNASWSSTRVVFAVPTPSGPGQSLTLICYDPTGQSINGYATWDQLSSGLWVYDGLMNTPPGGRTGLPKCANYPPDL